MDWTTLWIPYHIMTLRWAVEMPDELAVEFDALHEDVQTEILALLLVLEEFGPQLGRPRFDALKDTRHANMKELRFSGADGEWRVALAFDPKRRGILLVPGVKSGGSEKRFSCGRIGKIDSQFDAH